MTNRQPWLQIGLRLENHDIMRGICASRLKQARGGGDAEAAASEAAFSARLDAAYLEDLERLAEIVGGRVAGVAGAADETEPEAQQ